MKHVLVVAGKLEPDILMVVSRQQATKGKTIKHILQASYEVLIAPQL
jgi:hypothetical protein